jgi:hypothetical protein
MQILRHSWQDSAEGGEFICVAMLNEPDAAVCEGCSTDEEIAIHWSGHAAKPPARDAACWIHSADHSFSSEHAGEACEDTACVHS